MSLTKQLRDKVIRLLNGGRSVPAGLVELHHYFRTYEPIVFSHERQSDGSYIAISKNFNYGKIITQADSLRDLDGKIKDAILTAFEVPSSYAKEADIKRQGEQQDYVFA